MLPLATIYKHTTDKPNDEFTGLISDAKKDNMPYSFSTVYVTGVKEAVIQLREGKNSYRYKDLDS